MSSLSLEYEISFEPRPFIDPDVGVPFDLVPDGPGVLAFLNRDGSAMRIFEHTSLRALVRDAYLGHEGRDLLDAKRVAFEQCSQPAARLAQLLEEHQRKYGRAPARISA
jgi:hypothetical protein